MRTCLILLFLLSCSLVGAQAKSPPAASPSPSPASTAIPAASRTPSVPVTPAPAIPPLKALERQAPFPGSDFPPWQEVLVNHIGWRLSEAVEELGSPLSAWPVRGEQAFQDAVVFYYPDNSYLYFWDDRVWQIRLDKRYQGKVFGLAMGTSRAATVKLLGQAGEEKPGFLRYALPDRGWPVELLLYFEKDALTDLYLRRSDF